MLTGSTAYRLSWGAAPTTAAAAARRRPCGPARSRPPTAQSASSSSSSCGGSRGGAQREQPAAAAAAAGPEIRPQEPFVRKRGADGTFQKVERVPCPQLQAWLEAEQGLPAKHAADAAWKLSLAFQSEQAALASLPAAFAFCRSQQLSGPEAAAVLCHIARFRRENVVEFASHVQPVWLLLDTFFAAYVEERRQQHKRLPMHLTLGRMMCSNSLSAQALVMPPGHVQRWLDAVSRRLSAADLGAVLAKQPEVVSAVPEKAVATMDWAVQVLGVPDLARLVRGMPLLLQIETDTLQRKLGTIAAAVGVPEAQAKLLVLKLPNLLGLHSSEAMQDAAAWLRRYFPTTEELWPLLLRGPNLLATTADKLQRNADYLRAPPFSWDDQQLAAYIWQFPQGFSNGDFRSEKTEPKLLFLSEVVGVSRVDMIAVYPNYLKYSLPTMAAAYVLVREHAPEELVYQDGGSSLVFVQGRAEDLARHCGLAIEAVREHLREWPRRGEGQALLDELRQGSTAGWKPYLRQLDERAQVLRQARSQDGSGIAAVAKRRRRRRQAIDPPVG